MGTQRPSLDGTKRKSHKIMELISEKTRFLAPGLYTLPSILIAAEHRVPMVSPAMARQKKRIIRHGSREDAD